MFFLYGKKYTLNFHSKISNVKFISYQIIDRFCFLHILVPQDDLKESDEKWPSTKKMQQIAKLVPKQSMIQLCRALHIPCTPGDLDDEERRLEQMRRWKYLMAGQKQEKKHKALSAALKAINFGGG